MSHLTFRAQYNLGNEIAKVFPFVIHEGWKISDGSHVIIKMLCKLGYPPAELSKLQKELKLWRLVNHPRIVEVIEVYIEESFIYILYDYPEGGDLESMIIDNNCAFTEGFARTIAAILLDGLIYLHSLGIVHGGCTPTNIVFFVSKSSPGWIQTSKLAFYKVNISRLNTSIFSDLRDLAYTLCCVLRRKLGKLFEETFSPNELEHRAWHHLSIEFKDFIYQLWNAKTLNLSTESFLQHPWLTYSYLANINTTSSLSINNNPASTPNSLLFPLTAPAATIKPADRSTSPLTLISGEIQIKNNASLLDRWSSWKRVHASICDGMLIFKRMDSINKKGKQRSLVFNEATFPLRNASYVMVDEVKKTTTTKTKTGNAVTASPSSPTMAATSSSCTLALSESFNTRPLFYLKFCSESECTQWKAAITAAIQSSDTSNPTRSLSEAINMLVSSSSNNNEISVLSNLIEGILSRHLRDGQGGVGVGVRDGMDMTNPMVTDSSLLVSAVAAAATQSTEVICAQSAAYQRYTSLRLGLGWHTSSGFGLQLQQHDQSKSFAPFPSASRMQSHPAVKWEHRVEELLLVLATGIPLNAPLLQGQEWFIVDATWFRVWMTYLSSSRRMAVPGPVDNSWMINPETRRPYPGLREDVDEEVDGRQRQGHGDYRRVTPQIWAMLEEWYGGAPVITVQGPPLEDTTRWLVLNKPGIALGEFEDSESEDDDDDDEEEADDDTEGEGGGGRKEGSHARSHPTPTELHLVSMRSLLDENNNSNSNSNNSIAAIGNAANAIPKLT